MRRIARPPHLSFLHVLTRAQRTRVLFYPQHWLLCHLGLYYFEFEFGMRLICWSVTTKSKIMPESRLRGVSRLPVTIFFENWLRVAAVFHNRVSSQQAHAVVAAWLHV
jgi:hypothetical protein